MLHAWGTLLMQHPMHHPLRQSTTSMACAHVLRHPVLSTCPHNMRRAVSRRNRQLIGRVMSADVTLGESVQSSSWTDFSQNASGEWEGVTATFDARCGKVLTYIEPKIIWKEPTTQ